MDGNRRYASERQMSATEGHRQGAEKLKEVVKWAKDQGVTCVYVYAFSTENWKRDPREVAQMMSLLEEQLTSGFDELREEVSLRFVGDRTRFSGHIQKLMAQREQESAHCPFVLAILLSYGGRAEILDAVNTVLAKGRERVTEDEFSDALWSAGLPDPELIIRTGGDQRLSNFLPWQSVYSELMFTKTLWPAFTREEFDTCIKTYRSIKRNFGV